MWYKRAKKRIIFLPCKTEGSYVVVWCEESFGWRTFNLKLDEDESYCCCTIEIWNCCTQWVDEQMSINKKTNIFYYIGCNLKFIGVISSLCDGIERNFDTSTHFFLPCALFRVLVQLTHYTHFITHIHNGVVAETCTQLGSFIRTGKGGIDRICIKCLFYFETLHRLGNGIVVFRFASNSLLLMFWWTRVRIKSSCKCLIIEPKPIFSLWLTYFTLWPWLFQIELNWIFLSRLTKKSV